MNLDRFTFDGKFLMLALDHRGSIKKLMNPSDPDSISDEEVIQLKCDIINALMDQFSGVLIDENFGLDAYPKHEKPFLLPLEKSSHSGITELEYSIEDLIKLGASGAKILIDFDPDSENVPHQLELAKKVAEDCKLANFPFFLEIVTRTSTPGVSTQIHTGSVQMFLDYGIAPDVWKLEYPGSLDYCQEITDLVGETPWILLTGGQDFDSFKSDLEVATKGGAEGFLAGRALWQEVCTMQGEEKQQFLQKTLPERFRIISNTILS